MSITPTEAIQIVLTLAPLLPLGLIIQKLAALESKHVSPAVNEVIKSIVRTAVMAVEQTCPALSGPDKKAEAVRLISTLLSEHGLTVSPTMLDTLIEQSVLLLNQGQNPQQATQSVPAVKP